MLCNAMQQCNSMLFATCFQIAMEHWLYNGFPVGEPYTFNYTTYDPVMGVSENAMYSKLSDAEDSKWWRQHYMTVLQM